MQINELRQYNHPDISDHVVHFTGRNGTPGPGVPNNIKSARDFERLGDVLVQEQILAFPPFGTPDAVVCFTECTRVGIETLIQEGRYTPCGVAFTKDFVFRHGGGPALYIRGDEWNYVSGLPLELRARATRLWPGAGPDDGQAALPGHLANHSEWLHEREWRLLGAGTPPAFRFQWSDIAFVIAPHTGWAAEVRGYIEYFSADYAPYFDAIPIVAIDAATGSIDDPHNVWV